MSWSVQRGRKFTKNRTLILVIALQVLYALAYIYQSSNYVGALYQGQKLEQRQRALVERKRVLNHQLLMIKSRGAIQKFAKTKLGLQPIGLKGVKRLHALECQ